MLIFAFALVLAGFAFAPTVRSQDAVPNAKSTPNFSRLAVKPGGLAFKRIKFPPGPDAETRSFLIQNTGKGSTNLAAVVTPISGAGAASFTIITGAGALPPIAPGGSATVTIEFEPLADTNAVASILVTSNATKGKTSATVRLSGSAKGPIPTPAATATATATRTATATPTATATATSTASASPTATGTPGNVSQGPGTTDKNSANAPGVIITTSTKQVVAYVPFGSDTNNTHGAKQVAIEGASPLPTPALIATDRSNSCTPTQTGNIVCSGQGGSVDLIAGNGTGVTILPLNGGTLVANNGYAQGDCQGCGALVDDVLNLGIISSGDGFYPVTLAATLSASTVGTVISTNGEPVGANFGYDAAHHRILSANYKVTNPVTFASSPPHFQIIDISTPATPVRYELTNDQTIFLTNGRTCTGNGKTDPSDALPETTAIDTSTNIAYVTFHTPSDCFNSPPVDIALFDLSQATFTAGTNSWTTPGKNIQSITGTGLNAIDSISVEPTGHLALVAAGSNSPSFGVLVLPSTSGTGNPTITDWVGATMPNDPGGAPWTGWSQPNGLATYVSASGPTSGKPMGVMMNSGIGKGPTFLAIVDLQALVAATRSSANMTTVNLLTSNIVRFVKVQ